MIVRELITRLGFQLNEGQMNQAELRVKRLANFMQGALAGLASIATVQAIVRVGDEMQNIRTRLSLLPQTVDDVGAAFDQVAKRASEAGVTIEAYSSLYTRVGNAAKDYIATQEDLLTITDTISKALAVSGASVQESSAVMTQFSQALASGVLQGDEFRSMAEAAPQYLDKLSETMGIPRAQLKAMAADGKLTARDVIEATRKMANYFDGKFKQMPMTVGRATTIIANRFGQMIDKMNRHTQFITTIANTIILIFDKIEAGVEWLAAQFGGFGNMMRFLGFMMLVAFGPRVIMMLSALKIGTLAALLPFIKMIAIIAAVAAVLEDLYVWIQGGDSLIGSLIGPWEEWRPYVMAAVEMVGDALKWLGQVIGAVLAMVVGLFSLDFNQLVEGIRGLGEAVKPLLGAIASYFFQTLTTMLTGLGQLIRDAMLSWAKFIYRSIFDPIVNAVQNAWATVKSGASGLWEGAKRFAGMGSDATGATGGANSVMAGVGAGALAPAAMGAPRPNVQSTTNVSVTVPTGTTAEQARFLQEAAQSSFSSGNSKLARDLAIYAP